MLVLTRKNGEEILIGNDIRIEVLSIRGKTVRIGISAPKETPILRGEIHQQMQIIEMDSSGLVESA